MLIPTSTAALTVRFVADDAMPLKEAVITALPTPTPVTTPDVLTVAMPVLLDAQVAKLVRLAVVPSV